MSSEPRNIHQQIDEVERELRLRASVYPGFVARGKLRQAEADEHVARMEAVRTTLLWCRDNRDLLVAAKEAATPLHVAGAPPSPQAEDGKGAGA